MAGWGRFRIGVGGGYPLLQTPDFWEFSDLNPLKQPVLRVRKSPGDRVKFRLGVYEGPATFAPFVERIGD